MADDRKPSDDLLSGAAAARLFAAFASALSPNWASAMAFSTAPTGREGNSTWPSSAADWQNYAEVQLRAIASAWKAFGDVFQATVDAVSTGQDTAAEHLSRNVATAIRAFTGLDPSDIMKGAERAWSPQQVALRSFGFGDSDAVAMSAELVEFATASAESGRAALALFEIMNRAWIRAAEAFSETNLDGGKVPSDLVALQRAWVATAEPIFQQTLRSDAYVDAHADFLRTAGRQAKARGALTRRLTDFIGAPSRQEMNETYEAIQDLRREVRALKRNQKRLEKALVAAQTTQKIAV